jgi:glycosyltransferase involved in cell wall biosynthesis
MNETPIVTIAVPSFNQGAFLNNTLHSIFKQNIAVEVFVMDGGSTDNSIEIIHQWEHKLNGWRSNPDSGQAAAINEGISKGIAPYICWLNSDDWMLPDSLNRLISGLCKYPAAPAVYGKSLNYNQNKKTFTPVVVEPFDEKRLSIRCIISQPATLIRRTAWEMIGGLNEKLTMAMDYDLWWRLYKRFGPLVMINEQVAVNRDHSATKTRNQRKKHYKEAIAIIREHYGYVPLKWFIAQPYAIWLKALMYWLQSKFN